MSENTGILPTQLIKRIEDILGLVKIRGVHDDCVGLHSKLQTNNYQASPS